MTEYFAGLNLLLTFFMQRKYFSLFCRQIYSSYFNIYYYRQFLFILFHYILSHVTKFLLQKSIKFNIPLKKSTFPYKQKTEKLTLVLFLVFTKGKQKDKSSLVLNLEDL